VHRGAPIDQDRDAPSLDPKAQQIVLFPVLAVPDDVLALTPELRPSIGNNLFVFALP